MKILCLRYPRNTVTDILICLLCSFMIILIVSNGKTAVNTSGNDISDVVAFIEENGWEIDYSSVCTAIKKIPESFDKVYSDYNELQQKQGFDLSGFKGKTVYQYTYSLLNLPGFENSDDIFVNILMYDGVICAADICCTSINGFITGVVRK